MIHHGQSLSFGLEACDHVARIHSLLDDLQGHVTSNRLLLLGHVNHAETAFADLL
jgi:hypothetical protein